VNNGHPNSDKSKEFYREARKGREDFKGFLAVFACLAVRKSLHKKQESH